MENKTLLSVEPMESYEAPKVPTLDEVYKNPTPLKKLPKRWAKNAAVVACVGILGISTLSGCFSPTSTPGRDDTERSRGFLFSRNDNRNGYYTGYDGYGQYVPGYSGYEEFDLIIRLHGGGGGWASYVVHITEQEALSIIRTQLEAVGLRFNDTPPNYTVFGGDSWNPTIGLDLFDARNNVAVSHLTWDESNIPFGWRGSQGAAEVALEFANTTDINVGAFYTPGFFLDWDAMGDWVENRDGTWRHIPAREPTERQRANAKAEARPVLEERITAQVEQFISLLRAEGIIE